MEMLDFNSVQQPVWPVKLKDGTVVNISAPSVELYERLMATQGDMADIIKAKDGKTIQNTYAMYAEVMSNNEDGFTFTAEELRDKYRMTFFDLVKFTSGYIDFVKEITNVKN